MTEDQSPGRVPPHDLDAERAVIGSVLIDAAVMPETTPMVLRTLTMLVPQDFYGWHHRAAWEAILAIHADGQRPHDVLLADRLVDEPKAIDAAREAVACVSTPSSAEQFARIVAGHARARALLMACSETMQAVYAREEGAIDVLRKAVEAHDVSGEAATGHILEDVDVSLEGLMRPVDLKSGKAGDLGWRIRELDTRGSWIRPGDFPIVAGRPGLGKSTWALWWALQTALHAERPVVFCSFEMTRRDLTRKALCALAGVPDPMHVAPKPEHAAKLRDTARFMHQVGMPLYIPENMPREVGAFARWARGVAYRQKPAAMIVDYLGQLRGKGRSTTERVTHASQEVRAVAKDTKVPILALHQMNRNVEREDRMPRLDDLRDSGQVEQDATHVAFLHKAHKPMGELRVEKGDLLLVVRKSRMGKHAVVPMHADLSASRILPKNASDGHG